MKVRVLGPRLLIKIEDEAEFFKDSVLVKPDTVHETAVGWGEVLGIGEGYDTRKGIVPIEGVKVGDRVAFIKFLKEGHTNKLVASVIGEDMLIVEAKDIVVVQPA
jgi:co-chaperonin GroES (HSP10)